MHSPIRVSSLPHPHSRHLVTRYIAHAAYNQSPDMSKKRHAFNFPGGEQLTSIGASFFVSYLYSEHVDSTHCRWKSIETKSKSSRVRTIIRSEQHHCSWLERVDQMSDANLSKNALGLGGTEVKVMARAILDVFGNRSPDTVGQDAS